jgi:hypothetical protein
MPVLHSPLDHDTFGSRRSKSIVIDPHKQSGVRAENRTHFSSPRSGLLPLFAPPCQTAVKNKGLAGLLQSPRSQGIPVISTTNFYRLIKK